MGLSKVLELLVALFVVVYLVMAAVTWPRLGVAVWLAITCFVPSWLLIRAGVEWTPAGLCALGVLPVVLVRRLRTRRYLGDLIAVGIVVLCYLAYFQGNSPRDLSDAILVRGLLAYFVARCLAPRAGLRWTMDAFAIVLLICAAWSIGEYLLNLHIFEHFDVNSPEGTWAAVQTRGHHARSEAAFGDAIALGAALAMAVPFIFASSWRMSRKLIGLTLLGVGILATVSRGPMSAALVGVVLMVVLYRSANMSVKQRRVITCATLVVSVVLYIGLVSKITAAGSEASNSAAYRGKLYSHVLQDVRPLSVGENVVFKEHQVFYRRLPSIDSTFVYAALLYGWLPVAVFILALLALAWRALRLRAGPATIAMLAQIPVLATVAPITQYETLLWFLGGLVVVEVRQSRGRQLRTTTSTSHGAGRVIPPITLSSDPVTV